jgi:transcriptional regulator with XRE-family HTH domain
MNSRIILLKKRRVELGMKQSQVAERVGVCQQTYSEWETGKAPTPVEYHESLAETLGLDPDLVKAATLQGVAAVRIRRHHEQRHAMRRHYPLGASVDDVPSISPWGGEVISTARSLLSEEDFGVLALEYPRDTRHELLVVFTATLYGFLVVWTSPARSGCPWLVLHDFLPEYGGSQVQPALLWQCGNESILIFGQVRLKAPFVKASARVDFLIRYKCAGKRQQWIYVEIDGRHHWNQRDQDENRAEGLLIPELRYDNHRVGTRDWFPRFLEDVRKKAAEGAARDRHRKAFAEEERQKRIEEQQRRRGAA